MNRLKAVTIVYVVICAILTSGFLTSQTSENSISAIQSKADTRQSNATNYTQLCFDFIVAQYPGKNITILGSDYRIDSEIGINYTIVKAKIFPGSVSGSSEIVDVSIRHDTLHVEFGYIQIDNDAEAYYNSLPTPYKKIFRATRLMIKTEFSHLPTINETKELYYRTNVTYEVTTLNTTLLINDIEDMGYPYVLTDGLGAGNSVIYVNDITLYDALILTEKVYVKACSFYYLYPYTPHNAIGSTFIIGGGIGVGLGVLIGVLAIGMHSKNKKKKVE